MNCSDCDSPVTGAAARPRKNGRVLCQSCWAIARSYYDRNWFAKSLEFSVPTIAKRRGLKALPGQLNLLSDDQFRDAGRNLE